MLARDPKYPRVSAPKMQKLDEFQVRSWPEAAWHGSAGRSRPSPGASRRLAASVSRAARRLGSSLRVRRRQAACWRARAALQQPCLAVQALGLCVHRPQPLLTAAARFFAPQILKFPLTTESAMKKIEDNNTLVFIVDVRCVALRWLLRCAAALRCCAPC